MSDLFGKLMINPRSAAGLLDRFLYHAMTVNIRGDSYRFKNRQENGLTLREDIMK